MIALTATATQAVRSDIITKLEMTDGAPRSIEDYFQECGRAGRSGDLAKSVIYWIPVEAPLRKS